MSRSFDCRIHKTRRGIFSGIFILCRLISPVKKPAHVDRVKILIGFHIEIFREICDIVVNDSKEARRKAKQAGVVGYFQKPVDDQALLDTIQWALSNDSSTQGVN